jgi:flagellar hook-associated protein 3 FlgL
MGMRLTGLSNFLLFQKALAMRNTKVFKDSEQLSTQKQINRPSDDPQGARNVLSLRQSLDKMEQYQHNLTTGEQFLRDSEVTLSNVKDVLNRAKELAIQGRNGIQSQESRNAIAAEVQQLQQQLLTESNTSINGEYIFAGYRTSTKPFALDVSQPSVDPVATFSGDSNVRSVQISDASNLTVQSRGDLIFMGDGTAATVDLFQTLADLEVALRAGNIDDSDPSSIGAQIDNLQTGMNQVINEITSIGANENRVSDTQSYLDTQMETLKSLVSSIEDADIAQTSFDYQQSSLALQATINAAGNILRLPSLMDFLK